jgi:RNA polymerase sigma factor (TIGR02999 family)
VSDVTQILNAIEGGDPRAAEQLLPLVYDELRKLAAQRLTQERPGQTLQATALVHEAYLRLVGSNAERRWDSRGHFFAAAAEAMRRILIDRARQQHSAKRGGRRARLPCNFDELAAPEFSDDAIALDEALTRLAEEEPRKAKLVELRFFAGLSLDEAAATLGISPATADRDWAFARAWLFREISQHA